jgi:hypothetical protein
MLLYKISPSSIDNEMTTDGLSGQSALLLT